MFDSHNDFIDVVLLNNAAATAADTYTKYVDLQGYQSCELIVIYDAGTASAGNSFTPTVKVASATPGSTGSYATADSADLIGSFSAVEATGEGSQSVGYVGTSRYVSVLLDETGTASFDFTVIARLGHGKSAPVNSDTVTTGAIS